MIKTEIQHYSFDDISVQLCVPNNHDLFYDYKTNHTHQLFPVEGQKSTFPYWAKVWHSALALSQFIVHNKSVFHNKKILELAAGLGLPGVVASKYAHNVIISDYIKDALYYVNQSISKNNITNVQTQVIDWNNLPQDIDFDILLLSDVNYEMKEFDALEKLMHQFIEKGIIIVLATPQRLMAKAFINNLLPIITVNEQVEINIEDDIQFVNVMVLKK
jgi:predicted nicotinamide N-methyase